MEPLAVSVEEAARLLGISRSKMYLLLNDGRIDSLRIDTARRIPMDSIRSFVERNRIAADGS